MDERAQLANDLRAALAAWDAGDTAAFDSRVDGLLRAREGNLYAHVARLSRGLHQQVVAMHQDEHLARLAGDEMPDARHRLDYIMKVTEQAAHRTLDLVDQARGITDGLQRAAVHLAEAETVLAETHPDTANIGVLMHGVADGLRADAQRLRSTLSELAQAQEYQDIAGQLIKRVITLVRNVETALLELLRISGGALQAPAPAPITPTTVALAGPAVAGIGPAAASQQDADALLAELGF
ncbi:MAG TPA: protein phosphatase CheZ [Solimonas sp.]